MQYKHYFCIFILAVAMSLILSSDASSVVIPGDTPPSFIGYVKRSIVVKFDRTASNRIDRPLARSGRTGIPAVDSLAQAYGVVSIERQFPMFADNSSLKETIDLSDWHKIHFQTDVDIGKAVAAFDKLGDVIEAQPIGIHTVYRTPNDGQFPAQWHLDQSSDRDIDAQQAWDFESGNQEIIVAVLDTGVRYFHKDLGGANASISAPQNTDGNMWINQLEKDGSVGVDEDGNGYIDDWIGWDFVDGVSSCIDADCNIPDNDPRDYNGHGTHVAGIVSALNHNGYGVSSPAGGWGDGVLQPSGNGVKIMPLRIGWHGLFIIWEVGYVRMDFAAQALYYAAQMGARIVNASWSSSADGGLPAAVDAFINAGGIIFHAAGNDSTSSADYLGGRSDVINVAATGRDDCKASFSKYGSWVDVSAPGDDILNTYHIYTAPEIDYTAWLSGTSMASPLAASVAALIWSQNPSWTAEQVKMKLFDSTDDIYGLGCNPSYLGELGIGRVNAYLAVGSCEGDFNGNDVVDGSNLAELVDAFGCISACEAYDMTYDDKVDDRDLSVFAKDFGRTNCP